ncbi:MAG: ATP-binding protein [Jatrophihabitans sp.]|uniref:ATP-binding protein n=1 Tax=Jatrophihabitans sp. TaxID=1932789 RepID=UPI003F7D8346
MQVWGRAGELAALRAAVTAAGAGRPAVAIVAGESGIGKTTLLRAATETAATEGWTVRWARGAVTADEVPYGLWRHLLGPDAVGGDDRFAVFEAIRGALVAAAPLVLVIDDLQWVEESSVRALTYVVRRLGDERVAVLATLRPDDAGAGWSAVGGDLLADLTVTRLDLRPLGEADSEACLRAAAGDGLSDELVAEAVALARGNPFYLRELGRGWAVDPSRRVPRTVLDVSRQRLARLPTTVQELLLAASVVGEQAELSVLAHCVGRSTMECLGLAQEAIDAGLLVHVGGGWVRFAHALVHAALLDGLSLPQQVELHQRAAAAIEELHAGALDDHLAELARHAAAVAVTGNRAPAVRWARAAGEQARGRFAYEEAGRLFALALDSGGAALDEVTRADLLIGRAECEASAGRSREAQRSCASGVELARRLGDATLLARAALALEPVGDRLIDESVGAWCLEALAVLPDDAVALRARVLARRAEALVHRGAWDEALPVSSDALRLADGSGDDEAVVAALRARQLTVSGPDHRDERLALTERMTALGRRRDRADIEMWGRLWRLDALWEVAALPDIDGEVARLAACVERLRSPLPQWHLLVARSVLAQARGDYGEAMRLAGEGFALMRALGHPAGFGAFISLATSVGHHCGHTPMATETAAERPEEAGQLRAELFGYIGPALALCDLGRLDEAAALYERPGPPHRWRIPPYFVISAAAVGAGVAVALGRRDDVAFLRDLLVPYRDRHLVGGAGVGNYLGPVTLMLGRCAAALDDHELAERELRDAVATCRRIGLPGHAVEAQVELAVVLQARRRMAEATAVLRAARPVAERLAMTPWVGRIDTMLADCDDVLSPREREVAVLVAQGCTNRQIAERLVLSERTAANHVQHVLSKLGLNRRSELAAWMHANEQSNE